MVQLSRLMNTKLLRARESRRRALLFQVPLSVRLGQGYALCDAGKVPRISLASATHLVDDTGAGWDVWAVPLRHFKATSRALPSGDHDTQQTMLASAFKEAKQAMPKDMLARMFQKQSPSPGSSWELQRRLASHFGLNSLLTYVAGLRCTLAHLIVMRQDLGTVELVDFAQTFATESSDLIEVPFRLTPALESFISPLSIDGAFLGAMSAAAECLSNAAKCPLALWINSLSRAEHSAGMSEAGHKAVSPSSPLTPWRIGGQEAARRVAELSPDLVARSAVTKGRAAASVDLHSKAHELIEEATRPELLFAMPSSFQAWL